MALRSTLSEQYGHTSFLPTMHLQVCRYVLYLKPETHQSLQHYRHLEDNSRHTISSSRHTHTITALSLIQYHTIPVCRIHGIYGRTAVDGSLPRPYVWYGMLVNTCILCIQCDYILFRHAISTLHSYIHVKGVGAHRACAVREFTRCYPTVDVVLRELIVSIGYSVRYYIYDTKWRR